MTERRGRVRWKYLLTPAIPIAVVGCIRLYWFGGVLAVFLGLSLSAIVTTLAITASVRSMRAGATPLQIYEKWTRLPIVGWLVRFGNRMNSLFGWEDPAQRYASSKRKSEIPRNGSFPQDGHEKEPDERGSAEP